LVRLHLRGNFMICIIMQKSIFSKEAAVVSIFTQTFSQTLMMPKEKGFLTIGLVDA